MKQSCQNSCRRGLQPDQLSHGDRQRKQKYQAPRLKTSPPPAVKSQSQTPTPLTPISPHRSWCHTDHLSRTVSPSELPLLRLCLPAAPVVRSLALSLAGILPTSAPSRRSTRPLLIHQLSKCRVFATSGESQRRDHDIGGKDRGARTSVENKGMARWRVFRGRCRCLWEETERRESDHGGVTGVQVRNEANGVGTAAGTVVGEGIVSGDREGRHMRQIALHVEGTIADQVFLFSLLLPLDHAYLNLRLCEHSHPLSVTASHVQHDSLATTASPPYSPRHVHSLPHTAPSPSSRHTRPTSSDRASSRSPPGRHGQDRSPRRSSPLMTPTGST